MIRQSPPCSCYSWNPVTSSRQSFQYNFFGLEPKSRDVCMIHGMVVSYDQPLSFAIFTHASICKRCRVLMPGSCAMSATRPTIMKARGASREAHFYTTGSAAKLHSWNTPFVSNRYAPHHCAHANPKPEPNPNPRLKTYGISWIWILSWNCWEKVLLGRWYSIIPRQIDHYSRVY